VGLRQKFNIDQQKSNQVEQTSKEAADLAQAPSLQKTVSMMDSSMLP
jgi:hypothetical protein